MAGKASEPSNKSVFVSQNVPNAMIAGETYVVSVTMKNTGTTTWTTSGEYKLGSQNPQDNRIWGFGRVELKQNENIPPGQTKTFTFSVTAPANPGNYNFQWKMLREHVEWFGDYTPNVKVSVVLPPKPLKSPFGENNPFADSGEKTILLLNDLEVNWITDHFKRTQIDKVCGTTLDFTEIDEKMKQYHSFHSWFILNMETKCPYAGAMREPKEKVYIPYQGESLEAWETYLNAVMSHVKNNGWNIKIWSIDNEQKGLYVPAFDENKNKILDGCGVPNTECDKAAEAHANLVAVSTLIIRKYFPDAKIVPIGIAGGTNEEDYLFYEQILLKLKVSCPQCVDYLDYHDFNRFTGYESNYGTSKPLSYFKGLLEKTGFSGTPIIIKAGSTHTGKNEEAGERVHPYQTEREQAEYLFKRFVYHTANDVELIFYGGITEDFQAIDYLFGQNQLIYDGLPDGIKEKCDPKKTLPCPDKNAGVKKLGYHTFKFLNSKVGTADWKNAEIIQQGYNNLGVSTNVYKVTNNGKGMYIAWWDWAKDCNVDLDTDTGCRVDCTKNPADPSDIRAMDKCVEQCDSACVDSKKPTITLSVGHSGSVTVTEAIPDYSSTFKSYTQKVVDGKVKITLGKNPIYVEILE